MYQFFYLRPAMKYYSSEILTPEIMTKFSNYLVIVWIYLVLNIVFETSLFLVNKHFVGKELNTVKELLLLFDQCVH